jgi:alpha-glucosidase
MPQLTIRLGIAILRAGLSVAAVALLPGGAGLCEEAEKGTFYFSAGKVECPLFRPVAIEPPEHGFYSKRLDYEGIPIKAHKDVSDEAIHQARQRLAMMLGKLPGVRWNLKQAGAELHVIGKNQVTSDLPEHRHLKGKPFDGEQTVDQRTRGLGGRLASCGEENLLRLEKDRYRGRDICVHEFAHNIFQHGVPASVRGRFRRQLARSLDKGLWQASYAASNPGEFFAELSMWYWGTHGDLRLKGPKPENGREGLKKYDPEAFALLDDFYSGRIEIPRIEAARERAKRP